MRFGTSIFRPSIFRASNFGHPFSDIQFWTSRFRASIFGPRFSGLHFGTYRHMVLFRRSKAATPPHGFANQCKKQLPPLMVLSIKTPSWIRFGISQFFPGTHSRLKRVVKARSILEKWSLSHSAKHQGLEPFREPRRRFPMDCPKISQPVCNCKTITHPHAKSRSKAGQKQLPPSWICS
jgi:hypothetical protein